MPLSRISRASAAESIDITGISRSSAFALCEGANRRAIPVT
jgi:hypothetical protein